MGSLGCIDEDLGWIGGPYLQSLLALRMGGRDLCWILRTFISGTNSGKSKREPISNFRIVIISSPNEFSVEIVILPSF
jgi:hypothetical protein